MEVREGYKNTEVGVLPEDWEVVSLGNVIEFQGGAQPPLTTFIPVRRDGYIRLLQIRDYKTDKYETYIPINLARKFCDKDDIMIGRYGPPIFQILRGLEGAYNVALIKAIPKKELIKEYAYYFLKQDSLFNFVEKLSQRSSGQTGVDLQQLKIYPIALPTKTKQTAIATALSDADALINSLEKLIAKKRNIKQGAMQKLLQPKEGWKVKKLGEITTLMTNGFVGVATTHYTKDDDGILYIQGYNVEENSFNFTGIKRVTAEFHKQHSKSCLQEGDLLTIQTGDVGLTTIVPKNLEGTNCHALIITRLKKQNYFPLFFCYYLNSKVGRSRLKEIEAGSTMKHINVGQLIHFTVPIPPLKEQTRIATILSDMDAEIQALETKLEKYCQIKLGMMQNLLTGKIRLV